MVDGRDGDVFGSLVRRILVFWSFVLFLFCLIRAEGFPGVYVGLLGYFFLGCRVSLFSSFSRDFWIFSPFFFSRSGGSGVLSHGAGFGLGFHG